MGLEDIAMFRTLVDSVVLHPCDAVSTERLVEEMARREGIAYLRTLRQETPILYGAGEAFPIGGSKVVRQSDDDAATIIAAGVTVWEALAAYDQLAAEGIAVRVIDLYSIQPIDTDTLRAAALETPAIITVEDHGPAGGLGEAVLSALAAVAPQAGVAPEVHVLAVRRKPMSGSPAELRDYEEISAKAIAQKVREVRGEAKRGPSG
jgi:transketolase